MRVAGMHKMSEEGYVFVNRGADVRLGAWRYFALLKSAQQSAVLKRMGQTVGSV